MQTQGNTIDCQKSAIDPSPAILRVAVTEEEVSLLPLTYTYIATAVLIPSDLLCKSCLICYFENGGDYQLFTKHGASLNEHSAS